MRKASKLIAYTALLGLGASTLAGCAGLPTYSRQHDASELFGKGYEGYNLVGSIGDGRCEDFECMKRSSKLEVHASAKDFLNEDDYVYITGRSLPCVDKSNARLRAKVNVLEQIVEMRKKNGMDVSRFSQNSVQAEVRTFYLEQNGQRRYVVLALHAVPKHVVGAR